MQLQPQFTEYFNKTIAQFESQSPEMEVVWTDVPWAAMESKILAAVSAKTAPDVVNLNPNFAALLAGRNAWLTLDDRLSEEQRDRYLPNIWDASTIDGNSFGIPWYITTRIAIFNQNLLEAADISEPPQTYAQLAEAAAQIREETGKYAFFVTFVPEDSAEVLESFVQMGVDLVDAEGKAAFNTPEGKAAFQYWVDLYQQELLPKEVLTQGHRRAIELYQGGETALLSTGPQFFQTIAQNAPDIAEVSIAAPQITGETGKKGVAVMNLIVPQDSDRPQDAIDFALFVTNSDNQLEFAKLSNTLPSAKAALEDEYFHTLPSEATQVDRARIISAEQLKDAEVLLPPIADIKELQRAIYDNLQAAMLGEKTVEDAIADAAQMWDDRL